MAGLGLVCSSHAIISDKEWWYPGASEDIQPRTFFKNWDLRLREGMQLVQGHIVRYQQRQAQISGLLGPAHHPTW